MRWLRWLLPTPANDNWEETNESVTKRKRVIVLLERIRKQKALLTVNISGINGSFSSTLLSIDAKDNYFSIDELHPPEGHQHLSSGTRLAIHARAPGMDWHFRSHVESIDKDRDIHYYKLAMPAEVYFAQRREIDRVKISGTAKLSIAHAEGQLKGMLYDLSAGGVGAIVQSGIRLGVGERHTCFVELPNEKRLITQMVIRFAKPDPKPGYWRLGLEFIDLEADEKDIIGRSIRRAEQDY
jgi:c-di-GMP-binding flagellar brake protein YcgR